jgi:hypothetical protein
MLATSQKPLLLVTALVEVAIPIVFVTGEDQVKSGLVVILRLR